MQISRGIIQGAQKICCYGPEGIGKSYFASKFPNPVFSDTEGSTKHMDVARLPKASSWTMLIEQAKYIRSNPSICDTYIVDTFDWAERLCMEELCAKSQKTGIEDFGYGKGYTYLAEEIGRYLNLLTELIDLGINVVIVAHAQMRKFEQPDEMGAYDRWEMKLQKKVYPLVKEWADMVLFMNYKTYVINVDGQGAEKGTNKARGGKRVIYTTHHPCWDAKNRHDLLDEIPLDYDEIKHCIPARGNKATIPVKQETPPPAPPVIPEIIADPEVPKNQDWPGTEIKNQAQLDAIRKERAKATKPEIPDSIPKALADLMRQNEVTVEEIQAVVGKRGYYPADTPISNYDPQFIAGVLVGAWEQVFAVIKEMRFDDEIPY